MKTGGFPKRVFSSSFFLVTMRSSVHHQIVSPYSRPFLSWCRRPSPLSCPLCVGVQVEACYKVHHHSSSRESQFFHLFFSSVIVMMGTMCEHYGKRWTRRSFDFHNGNKNFHSASHLTSMEVNIRSPLWRCYFSLSLSVYVSCMHHICSRLLIVLNDIENDGKNPFLFLFFWEFLKKVFPGSLRKRERAAFFWLPRVIDSLINESFSLSLLFFFPLFQIYIFMIWQFMKSLLTAMGTSQKKKKPKWRTRINWRARYCPLFSSIG